MGELFHIVDLDNSVCGLRYLRCNASPWLSSERRIECTFLDTTHRLFGRPRIEDCHYFQHSQADDCAEVRSLVGRFYWIGSLTGDNIGCCRVPQDVILSPYLFSFFPLHQFFDTVASICTLRKRMSRVFFGHK